MWQLPSSAENSRTPQYDFLAIYGLLIKNVIGYEIFNLASSFNADEGRIILFPLLTSFFPIKAGEYTLYDLINILFEGGGPPYPSPWPPKNPENIFIILNEN